MMHGEANATSCCDLGFREFWILIKPLRDFIDLIIQNGVAKGADELWGEQFCDLQMRFLVKASIV